MADTSEPEDLTNEEHVSGSPHQSSPFTGGRSMVTKTLTNRHSPKHDGNGAAGLIKDGGGGDSGGTSIAKMQIPRSKTGTDSQSVETGHSEESDSQNQSGFNVSPKHKDPDRIRKDREREERVRQARERLEEERKKKLVELQEQQRQAQENREKQLEMRKKKIEDLRRRDLERRIAVEERRRAREDEDRNRRESLLVKAEERVARYEAWRRSGSKGGRGHVLGFGSATPRDICQPLERPRRSSSHSALVVRRSPNGSDSDYSFRPQRRALSACSTVRRHCCIDINRMGPNPAGAMPTAKHLSVSTSVLYRKRNSDISTGTLSTSNRPDSLLALNTIPEGRRSFLASAATPPTRPKSVVTLSTSSGSSTPATGGGVRLREGKSVRKPRPASVATSMPTFVALEPPQPSPRSKSSDRLARERTKTRGISSASHLDDKDKDKDEEIKKKVDKSALKASRRTLDRLSAPKQPPLATSTPVRETTPPKKEHVFARISPRKAHSTSSLAMTQKKPSLKEKTSKEHPSKSLATHTTGATSSPTNRSSGATSATSTPISTPTARTPVRAPAHVQEATTALDEDGGSSGLPIPSVGAVPSGQSIPLVGTPSTGQSIPPSSAPGSQLNSSASAMPTGQPTHTVGVPPAVDMTAEEYKAKLAEKRRQARERAEKEAEEERKRQEEFQRQEEEKRRQEEEEQRRQEEEALKLEEELRHAEEERLQKAIEAEERRKAEEAARLEQERLVKEEAEKRAKEEAERLEQERVEKARREEEERQERKKRLEMIMKRVKTEPTDIAKEATSKSLTSSPTKSVMSAASTDVSPIDTEVKPIPGTTQITYSKDETDDTASGPESDYTTPRESKCLESGFESAESGLAFAPVPTLVQEYDILKPEMEKVHSASLLTSSPAAAGTETALENGGDRPKFRSPLLQKLVEGKEDIGSSERPKFKSPLLQNLLGKTKVGPRIGMDRQDHSVSTPDLSRWDHSGNGKELTESQKLVNLDVMSASMVEMGAGNLDVTSISMVEMGAGDVSRKQVAWYGSEEKDIDTNEESSSSHSSPSHHSTGFSSGVPFTGISSLGLVNGSEMEESGLGRSSHSQEPFADETLENYHRNNAMEFSNLTDSSMQHIAMETSRSSLWTDTAKQGVPGNPFRLPLNGHEQTFDPFMFPVQVNPTMEDSSISMRSVDSVISSSIADSATGSVFSSVSSLPQSQIRSGIDKDFEEIIDLTINNKTNSTSSAATFTTFENSEDLLNFNRLPSEESGTSITVPPPIYAFEESSVTQRQDITDFLS